MKKYLFTAIISLTLSIALLVHLYKTKDIEWVDAIVESSTAALGIKPKMVSDKIERKSKQQQIALVDPLTMDTTAAVQELHVNMDSTVVAALPLVEDKPKSMVVPVVAKVDTASSRAEVIVIGVPKKDSVVSAMVEQPAPPKRKLFNATIDPTAKNSAPKVATVADKILFFKAEVNTPQRFQDDQEITFRTSESVKIGDVFIPEKFVFRAKANVFDGRIHFIVKSIRDVNVKGENFKEQLPGMPLRAEFRLDESYFLSEGYPVVFGLRL